VRRTWGETGETSSPSAWVGRSLREIDCRARYGVAVLAVQRTGTADWNPEVPDPDRPLVRDDRLVLAGPPRARPRTWS